MNELSKKKIIVGMSGGVDSSVAAYLLMRQGYQVEGLFMKNWEEDDTDNYCPARIELEYAQQVCNILNIPLHLDNFATEYWEQVFSYFLAELKLGRTPNPDIICNKEIKFKSFLNRALELGADYIATGHYAQKYNDNQGVHLKKAQDQTKDQTYFLHALNEQQIACTLFPLGHLYKSEVRKLAQELNFNNYDKKDSTGICFIGERKFKDFLQNYIPAKTGDIVDTRGKVLGQHSGTMFYTIGQRKGLGIGGIADSGQSAWFVVAKDVLTNKLIVVQDRSLLQQQNLEASDCSWINDPPADGVKLTAKVRYQQIDSECIVQYGNDAKNRVVIEFKQQQTAITPGQFVVFYNGDICLGGAVIDRSW